MTWFIQELNDDVTSLHGAARAAELKPTIASLPHRSYFARYHYHEAKRLIEGATCALDDESMLAWMFSASSTSEPKVKVAVFESSAHVMACVQNLHSIGDLFGYAIYLALTEDRESPLANGQNYSPYAKQVLARLHAASPLQTAFDQLLNGGNAKYINALSNSAKHRNLITTPFTMDFTGEFNPPHGLKFQAFEYRKKVYKATWVFPLLENEIIRIGKLIESVGQALNAEVKHKLGVKLLHAPTSLSGQHD